MEGSGLDLADVIHAQIPGERNQCQHINQCATYQCSLKVLGTCKIADVQMLFTWRSIIESGSSTQREVRGLGREVGVRKGRRRRCRGEFSPMNHCWAAVISSSSQRLFLFSRCLILPTLRSDPSVSLHISLPLRLSLSPLFFSPPGSSGDHLLSPLFRAET